MVQERTPLRKSTEAVGHAVLALYFYAGATDVYAETGEQALIKALDRLWDSVVNKKMYITGACGQTHHGSSPKVDMVHEAFIKLTGHKDTGWESRAHFFAVAAKAMRQILMNHAQYKKAAKRGEKKQRVTLSGLAMYLLIKFLLFFLIAWC